MEWGFGIVSEIIVSKDGTEIPKPESEPTMVLKDSGEGYIAFPVSEEQIKNYYEAVSTDIHSAEAQSDALLRYHGLPLSSDVTRYDLVQDIDPSDITSTDPKEQIERLRDFYQTRDPLLGGIVDVLAELTAGPLRHEGGSPEVRKLFEKWAFEIKLDDLNEQAATEYWLSGNIFINRALVPVTKKSLTPFTEFLFSEGLGARKTQWTKKTIPTTYALLDPLSVKLEGEISSLYPTMKIPEETRELIKEKMESGDKLAIIQIYGEDFVKDALSNSEYGRLEPKNFGSWFYKKQSYQRYSFPPGGRAIPWLQYKIRLRNLNLNTISNALSFIILIKLGSDKYPTTKAQLKTFATLWKERPRRNPSAVFFQPHTTSIEIISITKESYALLQEDIFDQPNLQIAQSFGINLALITGISKSSDIGYSLGTIALRPTIRRIIKAQMKAESFYYSQYLDVGRRLGIDEKDIPRIRHIGTGLENVAEIASAYTNALDRGLSIKTYLEKGLGLDFFKELEQKQFEIKEGTEEVFKMRGSPTQKGKNGDDGFMPTGRIPGNEPPSTNPDRNLKTPPSEIRLGELYEEERETIEGEM